MLGTIIWAIVIGAVIGALGRLLLPGRQNIGIWMTLAVGIGAALLGSLVAQLFGVATTPGVDWIELLFQIAFAVIGVALVVKLRTGRAGGAGRA